MSTSLASPQYPFDPIGNNPLNRIPNELQALSGAGERDYYFIIPEAAPFYADSMQLSYRSLQGDIVPLTEGIDFYLSHGFLGATKATGKAVNGSITITNKQLKGTLILAYQTVGDTWVVDPTKAAEILAQQVYDPRIITWDQVAGYPTIFPPIPHEWNLVDMVGMKEVNESLIRLADAFIARASDEVYAHVHNVSGNPHGTTAEMLGAVTQTQLAAAVQSAIQAAASDTDKLREGDKNLFFTEGRVLDTKLTGYIVGQNASLAESDEIIEAFGKLQAQQNAAGSAIALRATSTRPAFNGLPSNSLEKVTMNGSISLDVTKGDHQITIKGSGAIAFNTGFVGDMTGRVVEFGVSTINDNSGNAYAIAWPSNVKWVDGIVPDRTTTPNAKDYYYFFSEDNMATWSGSLSNKNPF